MSPSRLQIAKQDILETLEASGAHVFTKRDLASIMTQNTRNWRLAQNTRVDDFIRFLIQKSKLRPIEFTSDDYGQKVRYAWGDVSPFELALSLRPNSFLSHGTAFVVHGLTNQILRTIYVNQEQSPKRTHREEISQERLNSAFAREQRTSNYRFRFKDWKVVVLNGKHTGRLEVQKVRDEYDRELFVTGLERTLIDAVVRPEYAGGVYQVLEAFKVARERASSNTLQATLKRLDYAYPYHQAVGFYMQRAGYEVSRWMPFKKLGAKLDFYLSHGLKDVEYDQHWRLFVPKGF